MKMPVNADPEIVLLIPDEDTHEPELSIVIPALNEELTVGDFVGWCSRASRRPGSRARS